MESKNDLTHVREYKEEQCDKSDSYSVEQLLVSYKEVPIPKHSKPQHQLQQTVLNRPTV